MEKVLVSIKEAAALLSINPRTVHALVNQKTLPSIRLGRRKMIRVADIHKLAASSGATIHARVCPRGVAIDGE
ncbi:MAG: helix-turn-helix domain-containing protein [Acidobacteriales bacterium]|nr:helix-turn-helix domain-containing protein [Terriglobales bacterium]